MFNMLNMLYFLLFSKIITATSFMSYNASSVSAQNAEAAAESSYDSSYSAGLFIDCSSCKCPLPNDVIRADPFFF